MAAKNRVHPGRAGRPTIDSDRSGLVQANHVEDVSIETLKPWEKDFRLQVNQIGMYKISLDIEPKIRQAILMVAYLYPIHEILEATGLSYEEYLDATAKHDQIFRICLVERKNIKNAQAGVFLSDGFAEGIKFLRATVMNEVASTRDRIAAAAKLADLGLKTIEIEALHQWENPNNSAKQDSSEARSIDLSSLRTKLGYRVDLDQLSID